MMNCKKMEMMIICVFIGMLFLALPMHAKQNKADRRIDSQTFIFELLRNNYQNKSNLSSFFGFADSKTILMPDDYATIQEAIEAAS
jgi:hypothetical protein